MTPKGPPFDITNLETQDFFEDEDSQPLSNEALNAQLEAPTKMFQKTNNSLNSKNLILSSFEMHGFRLMVYVVVFVSLMFYFMVSGLILIK